MLPIQKKKRKIHLMNIQYTKWQTQRRCAPDTEQLNIMLLIKACSRLNLTYQIYYLAEDAEYRQVRFILRVTKGCKLSGRLCPVVCGGMVRDMGK